MAKPIQATNLAGHRTLRRGVTLMESLIASVVLAVAVVGISGTLVATSQQAKEVDDSAIVNSLANALMEEVLAKPFTAPTTGDKGGWDTGNRSRSTYDNMADFHHYTDTSPFTSIGGRVLDPGTGNAYTREVQFEYRDTPSTPALGGAPAMRLGSSFKTFMQLISDPWGSAYAAASAGVTAGPVAVAVDPEFGLVSVKVASSSGKYVILNRLVSNTTYKK